MKPIYTLGYLFVIGALSGCAAGDTNAVVQSNYQCKNDAMIVYRLPNGNVQVQWQDHSYLMKRESAPVGYLYGKGDMRLWLNRDQGVLARGDDRLTHGCRKTEYMVSQSVGH